MDVNHKHEVGQSAKGGFGAAFGSVFGKFFGCIGVLLLIVIFSALVSTCSGENPENKVAVDPSAPVVDVTAASISKAFQENEAKAKLEYDGKTVRISGSVKEVGLDFADAPVIKLRGSGDVQGMGINKDGKVTDVSINGLSTEDAAAINKGQEIAVLCSEVTEVLGGPQLSGCNVAK